MKTKHRRATAVLLAAVLALSMSNASAFAADKELVQYRLASWKSIHFDDAKQADVHLKTVKMLGCEATKSAHGGHTDVKYRCVNWQQIELPTHNAAHAWERWLKASGFETKHAH